MVLYEIAKVAVIGLFVEWGREADQGSARADRNRVWAGQWPAGPTGIRCGPAGIGGEPVGGR